MIIEVNANQERYLLNVEHIVWMKPNGKLLTTAKLSTGEYVQLAMPFDTLRELLVKE